MIILIIVPPFQFHTCPDYDVSAEIQSSCCTSLWSLEDAEIADFDSFTISSFSDSDVDSLFNEIANDNDDDTFTTVSSLSDFSMDLIDDDMSDFDDDDDEGDDDDDQEIEPIEMAHLLLDEIISNLPTKMV